MAEIQDLDVSAFIALILIQTSNLRRLSFSTAHGNMDDITIWQKVGKLQTERKVSYLPGRLKELRIEYVLDWCYPSFGDVEDLYLPFIKDLDVFHVGPLYRGDPPKIGPGSLNISNLKLQVSQPGNIIIDFIKGCKALRSFEYRVVEDDGGLFPPGHLRSLLRAHAHCLEEFTGFFGVSYVEEPQVESDEKNPRYGSFADFVYLKRMDVEGCLINRLRRAEFPPALEMYTVRTEGDYHRDISTLLNSSRDAGFPPLKMNVIAETRTDGNTFEQWEKNPDRECRALVEMLRGTRISVRLVVTSGYHGTAEHLVFADADGYRREADVEIDTQRLSDPDGF